MTASGKFARVERYKTARGIRIRLCIGEDFLAGFSEFDGKRLVDFINAAHESLVSQAVQAETERSADLVHGFLHGECENPDISVGNRVCGRCLEIYKMEKAIRERAK